MFTKYKIDIFYKTPFNLKISALLVHVYKTQNRTTCETTATKTL